MYFWTKVGAEKSVKYNVLTRLCAFRQRGARQRRPFSLLYQWITQLTSP